MTKKEMKEIFIFKLEREREALNRCREKRNNATTDKERKNWTECIYDYRKTMTDIICMMHVDFKIVKLDESMQLYNKYIFGLE